MEIWRDIEGFEGLYQVSSEGRVICLERIDINNHPVKEKILKSNKNRNGYLQVVLCKEGKHKNITIHKLVASAFIDNPDNKPCIDHINTDRTDNRVENLRWVSQKENCNNPITKVNIAKSKIGNKHPMYGKISELNHLSKPILQFTKEGEFIRKWVCARDVERELGINPTHISSCCKGKKKSAGGFIWMYAVINGFTIDINKLKKVA